jgi:hypothetical protein
LIFLPKKKIQQTPNFNLIAPIIKIRCLFDLFTEKKSSKHQILGPASFQSADHCFKCRLGFTCVDYLNGDFLFVHN